MNIESCILVKEELHPPSEDPISAGADNSIALLAAGIEIGDLQTSMDHSLAVSPETSPSQAYIPSTVNTDLMPFSLQNMEPHQNKAASQIKGRGSKL